MNTASQSAGPPEGKAGKPDASPRPGAGARPVEAGGEDALPARKRAAGTATRPAPKKAAAAPSDSNGGPGTPAKKAGPSSEKAAGAQKTGNGGGTHGGNGSAPGGPGDGTPGPLSWPWARIGLYGLAGLVGGAVVAGVLLLTDGRGASREQVAALKTQVEALTKPLGSQRAGGTVAQSNLAQISEELVRLDTRLSKLKGDVTRTRALLSGRLEALEAATPADLPKVLQQWSGQVETLRNRITRLERDEISRDVHRASMALALANLTRATESSQPFVNELTAIELLDPGNRLVADLKPYAASGLPSAPALTGRFDKVADKVVRVWRKEHGRGVFEWLWDSIVNLFSVRPVGNVEGAKAPAIVARAEQRLKEGELRLAVDELSKLDEPEKAAAAEWLEAARARLRLDTLVAEVNRSVLAGIAEAEAERKAREEAPAGPSAQPEGESPGVQPAPPEVPETPEPRSGGTPKPESAPDTDGGAPQTEDGADSAPER